MKNRRFADRVSCGFDGLTEVICCKTNGTRPLGVRSRLACEQVPKYTSRLTFHIIDGEEASEGEFPFMAALGYPTDDETQQNISYRCGASMISTDFLLTAAHCIPTNDRPTVAILGTNNLAPGNHGVLVGLKVQLVVNLHFNRTARYNRCPPVPSFHRRSFRIPTIGPTGTIMTLHWYSSSGASKTNRTSIRSASMTT